VENPQNQVENLQSILQTKKNSTKTKNKITLGRTCIQVESQEWVGVKGLVTANYTILNQRVLRYVVCNTGASFDEANAAWLASHPFNEGALGEVLGLQGREDFIQLLANLPNVIS
jgi:hypothetical protein